MMQYVRIDILAGFDVLFRYENARKPMYRTKEPTK